MVKIDNKFVKITIVRLKDVLAFMKSVKTADETPVGSAAKSTSPINRSCDTKGLNNKNISAVSTANLLNFVDDGIKQARIKILQKKINIPSR